LRDKYLAGGPGTYTRPSGSDTWARTGGGDTPGAYIITKDSYGGFTATKNGATIIQSTYINDVIDGIRTHATGTNPTIQFGNGTATLEIGRASAKFNNVYGSTWGLITLTGKITSSYEYDGTLYVEDSVSVTSSADIANNYTGNAIKHSSTGTLTISGGTITSSFSASIYNAYTGTVSITGGTVSKAGDGNFAIFKGGTGKVTIGAGATIVGNKYGVN